MRKNVNKKLTSSILLGLMMTTSIPINSYATPDLETIEMEDIDELTNEEKIQIIDNAITEAIVQIEEKEEEIKQNEASLENKQKLLIDTQKQYQAKKDALNNTSNLTLRSSQNGELKILDMLLSSNSISEFLQNIELSKLLIKQNNKTLKTLDEQEEQLIELQEEITKEQEQLALDKESLEKDKVKLEELKAEVEETIRKEEEERQRQLELERLRELEYQQSLTSNNTGYSSNNNNSSVNYTIPDLNVPASERASVVIEYAKQFLGLPYVWGGSTPSGFDCSGFTSYVFKNAAGVSLPRVAKQQQLVGQQVSLSDLQAGDLLFWGYPAHHVGIYIGNGKYIHSPQTGDVVKISNVNWSKLTSATRVL